MVQIRNWKKVNEETAMTKYCWPYDSCHLSVFFLMNRGARSILLHKVKYQIFSRYRVTSYIIYLLIWLCLYAVKKKHFNVKMTVTVELSLRQFVFGWILCIFSILFCDLLLFIIIKHRKKVIFHGITDLFFTFNNRLMSKNKPNMVATKSKNKGLYYCTVFVQLLCLQ